MKKTTEIKLVATDIDGVWTNSIMYYTKDGDHMKAFTTYDGMGVQLLREIGIPTVIITSENSEIVLRRAEKLLIEDVYINEKDKLSRLKNICVEKNISLNNIAYIGDDLNDLKALQNVGFSAMPKNSPILERFSPDYITNLKGGRGAFREFVDQIINNR